MRITNQGILLDEVYDVQVSTLFSGSFAIIDASGAIIQIPQAELEKIIMRYNAIKQRKVQPVTNTATPPAPKKDKPVNLDDYFTN